MEAFHSLQIYSPPAFWYEKRNPTCNTQQSQLLKNDIGYTFFTSSFRKTSVLCLFEVLESWLFWFFTKSIIYLWLIVEWWSSCPNGNLNIGCDDLFVVPNHIDWFNTWLSSCYKTVSSSEKTYLDQGQFPLSIYNINRSKPEWGLHRQWRDALLVIVSNCS